MSDPGSKINQRKSFVDSPTRPGETAQEVIIGNQASSPVPVYDTNVSFVWDRIEASYPTATQEIYEYYLGATLVRTIDITYTDNTKRDIDVVLRT